MREQKMVAKAMATKVTRPSGVLGRGAAGRGGRVVATPTRGPARAAVGKGGEGRERATALAASAKRRPCGTSAVGGGRDAGPPESSSPEYRALEQCQVFRVSDAKALALTEMWSPDERAFVAFGRSFG